MQCITGSSAQVQCNSWVPTKCLKNRLGYRDAFIDAARLDSLVTLRQRCVAERHSGRKSRRKLALDG